VNVFDKIEDHSADKIYKAGVSMSISTDARMITPVTLASEYSLLEKVFNWDKGHFLNCNLEAIEHAFIEPELKQLLRMQIKKAYVEEIKNEE
jgi:adenosine deaminase